MSQYHTSLSVCSVLRGLERLQSAVHFVYLRLFFSWAGWMKWKDWMTCVNLTSRIFASILMVSNLFLASKSGQLTPHVFFLCFHAFDHFLEDIEFKDLCSFRILLVTVLYFCPDPTKLYLANENCLYECESQMCTFIPVQLNSFLHLKFLTSC